jgi:hypothetical protein
MLRTGSSRFRRHFPYGRRSGQKGDPSLAALSLSARTLRFAISVFPTRMFPEKIVWMVEPSFVCRTCGQSHEGIPLSFAADFPDVYANISESERGARALISSDQCIVDEVKFFIRGCLEIPVRDSSEIFIWGLWSLVKEEVFDEVSESWEEAGRETCRGPFKARLANSLSLYPETLNLKLRIVVRPVGTRPLFILEEDHPLATAQQLGISRLEAMELSSTLLHIQGPWSKSPQ